MDPSLSPTKDKMIKSLEAIKGDLSSIRTGRAAPSLVENISVSVYGGSARMRVLELATIGASDSQSLVVTPFDPSVIDEIRKGIMEANMGLNPVVDAGVIRISIPPLSQERREELIHLMRQKLESGKIMIRQIRHEAMDEVKKELEDKNISEDDLKRIEKEIQNMTDEFITEIEALGKKKEEELLTV